MSTLSEFTLHIMVIFLPGIVIYKITDELTEHKEHKGYDIVLYSFLYGFFCYFVYYIFLTIANWITGEDNFPFHLLNSISDRSAKISFGEILRVSILSVFLGFLFTYAYTYEWLHRFARRIGATRKHGDVDAFSHIMNRGLYSWVVVRDFEHDRAYYGWVFAFSTGAEKDELFLTKVQLYVNSSGVKIGDIPAIYLPKAKEKMIIEFLELPIIQ
ncbi:MAG: DUF6338 family protein [Candidatus Omnitrophota bacterium]